MPGRFLQRVRVPGDAMPALLLAAAATAVAATGQGWRVTGLLLLLGLALGWIARLRRTIRTAARRVAEYAEPARAPSSILIAGVTQVEQRMQTLRHRMVAVHPVSGLPVREGLVERIASDGHGRLGIVAFTDFDRLSAFDPMLADRVFAACSARLRTMMPPDRFLAQIDRGHIGAWFGPDCPDVDAWAELDAVAYALGELIVDGDTQIIPQVAVRLAPRDPDDPLSPAAFVTKALASLAIPAEPAAGTVQPVAPAADGARERFALEQDLRLAIDRRELRLAYQPLIDASQGCVCGAEALIRWEHPTRGLISPAHFVPLIEAMGLAREIGGWALNTAVREAGVWSAAGLGRLRVAVNVSSLQLETDELPHLVQRTLQNHGVNASQLEIELTESVATSDAEHCRGIFHALRAMGVKLAVDDFGTGYSGFSALRTLAFDKIKIDREFVTDVDSRGDSQAICQSIIALGRGLGIRVLAEGVERFAEYEWLSRHGCHHFQGYYFGLPMAGEALLQLARDQERLAGLLATRVDANRIMERLTA